MKRGVVTVKLMLELFIPAFIVVCNHWPQRSHRYWTKSKMITLVEGREERNENGEEEERSRWNA